MNGKLFSFTMEISQWDQHYYGNSKTWQQWTVTTQLYSCVSFIGEFSPNFDLKNMISTYRKDFSLVKKWSKNSPVYKFKTIPNRQSFI
jgi:hypothetical protein